MLVFRIDFSQGDDDKCLFPIPRITGCAVKYDNVNIDWTRSESIRASFSSKLPFQREERLLLELLR